MAKFVKMRHLSTLGKIVLNLSKHSSPFSRFHALELHRFACFETSISALRTERILNFNTNCFLAHSRFYAKRTQGKAPKGGKSKTIILSDDELSEVIDLAQYRNQLSTVTNKMKQDFIDHLSINTSAGIDQLPVNIENQTYPLNELAQISKKGQNLICINLAAFPEGLKPTLQAITESGAAFNPQQEGTMIYISVPKVTREHRETLAKHAKSLFTKSKDEVKTIQNQYIRNCKGQHELSEDLVFNATKQIMHIAEDCVIELEKIMKTRQNELLKD